MGNYRVAWVLLVSYVALLAFSSCGIGISFIFSKAPKPDPPKLNVTTPKPETDYDYDRSDRHSVPPVLKKYADDTREYANYDNDPQVYLVLPCGVTMLMIIPIVLGGLCSRKIFSTSLGLYSSVTLWGLILGATILYQNAVAFTSIEDSLYVSSMTVLGVHLGMLAIITPQIILAAWELRRQKIEWPVLNISHLFTFNAAFLIGRIVLGMFMISEYQHSFLRYGIRDSTYDPFYSRYYWDVPKLKCPEYYAYPMCIALFYGVLVPIVSLMSLLFGHLHTKMLSFSTLLSSIFYGGLVVVTSPLFAKMAFATTFYPEYMNWAIGLMFVSLVHAIASMAKPAGMSTPPPFTTVLANELLACVTSSGYSSDGLRNRASTLRSKFKGSDTLLYNTILLVLNSVAIISALCYGIWWWAGYIMIAGNMVIVNRILPALIMETLTQKVESTPVLKLLIHVFLESCLLIIGISGSITRFDDGIAVAIICNIIVLIMQAHNLLKNPALRTAAKNLTETETDVADHRHLMAESQDESESSRSEELQSGGIYQPVA